MKLRNLTSDYKDKHFKLIRDAGFRSVRINLHALQRMDAGSNEPFKFQPRKKRHQLYYTLVGAFQKVISAAASATCSNTWDGGGLSATNRSFK